MYVSFAIFEPVFSGAATDIYQEKSHAGAASVDDADGHFIIIPEQRIGRQCTKKHIEKAGDTSNQRFLQIELKNYSAKAPLARSSRPTTWFDRSMSP